MSAAPPPAYSSVSTGEGVAAPPPDYNANAAKSPPSYNPAVASAPPPGVNPAAVPQPQPAIKYVDQYGNPINMPQSGNVKYVDQYGNPVNPPQAQPAIKYVDQHGNPVNMPQNANVKYVDQYGNPVNPPAVNATPAAANVKYVDQHGNPINMPQNANVKYVDQYGNPVNPPPSSKVQYADVAPPTANAPTQSKAGTVYQTGKQQRTASFVLGSIAILILFIGLCVNNLARGHPYIDGLWNVKITCGWTQFIVDCGGYYSSSSSCTDGDTSYSDLCDVQNSIQDSYGYNYSEGPSWCGTKTAASLSLVCMLFGTITALIGVILINPCCHVAACACQNNGQCGCPRAMFCMSMVLGIIALVVWLSGDDVCLASSDVLGYDMGMGGSMTCQIIGMILVMICAVLAR